MQQITSNVHQYTSIQRASISISISISIAHDQLLHLRDDKPLDGVSQLPVADLVAQDGQQFGQLDLLNEGVEQDDPLALEESVEVSVGVGTTARAVDRIYLSVERHAS